MEGGDWSEVIDRQTNEALGNPSPASEPSPSTSEATSAAAQGDPPIISPFTQASVHRTVGESNQAGGVKALTLESADQALNEVGLDRGLSLVTSCWSGRPGKLADQSCFPIACQFRVLYLVNRQTLVPK